MLEVIDKIDGLLGQVEADTPVRESLQWYLANNLRDYRKVLEANQSKLKIDNATRAFIRFCTESIDWDTPLYKSCMEIAALGGKLAKS